jgi:protein tyrosine phosphatase (PTP) superfamily phosphohydrolase (DUF442 family)
MWDSRRQVQVGEGTLRKTVSASPPVRRRRRWWRIIPILGVIVVLACRLLENFQTVIPQSVYRSGQLSPASLQRHIARYHLRSVINLRGENADETWYQEERAMAAHCGVRHYDMPTDSGYPPTSEDLREWLRVLASCEKPVLIHCHSGIDRTGPVAAVCVLWLDPKGTPAGARAQFSWRYGHLPWRANRQRHLAFLDLYFVWLQQQGLAHDRDHFEKWATAVYQPEPEWVLESAMPAEEQPDTNLAARMRPPKS